MTGFGRGESSNELHQVIVEVKSVNHRYQEVYVRTPRHGNYLEQVVRNYIKQEGGRGKYEVNVELSNVGDSKFELSVDLALANAYYQAYKSIAEDLEINDTISLSMITRNNEVIVSKRKEIDYDEISNLTLQALECAMRDLWHMRKVEGERLSNELLGRLNTLGETIEELGILSANLPLDYKRKLQERIEELLGSSVPLDKDRLENEVAYYADKLNVEEEINRLKSHILQFQASVILDEPVGRKLDFLVQEMNREVNTIGSKSNDESIAGLVIDLKAEIEKMREQIQNLA